MPTDPATVQPLTDADICTLFDTPNLSFPGREFLTFSGLNEENSAFTREFAHAIYALAASRVDTAEVERRAKYEALMQLANGFDDGADLMTAEQVRHAAEDLYAPAPRECVSAKPSVVSWHEGGWCKYDLADETGKVVGHVDRENAYYPLGTLLGRYITGNLAKNAVESAFAAEVGQ